MKRPRADAPDPFSASGKRGEVDVEALIAAARRPGRMAIWFSNLRGTVVPCVICQPGKAGAVDGKVRVRVRTPPWGLANEWWVRPESVRVRIGHSKTRSNRMIPLLEYRPKVEIVLELMP